MNKILNALRDRKNISSFEELKKYVREEGFEISDSEINTPFSNGEKPPLLLRLERLAAMVISQSTPPDSRNDESIYEDAKVSARIHYLQCTMGEQKELFFITREACNLIATTKLTAKINQNFCNAYFKKPVFIYSSDEYPLFEDVNGIAAFFDDEKFLTVIISTKQGRLFFMDYGLRDSNIEALPNHFERLHGEDFISLPNGYEINTKDVDKVHYALNLISKFVLLLVSEKKPLIVEKQGKKNGKPKEEKRINGTLLYKKVSLTYDLRQKYKKDRESFETHILDKEGKVLKAIKVTGHIRMQPYGPNLSKVKPIYIAEHDSKAWVNEGIKLVKVIK